MEATVMLASRRDDSTVHENPTVIKFFDVEHTIFSPGIFNVVYKYKTNRFVPGLVEKFEIEDCWLGTLNSNTLKFSVRLPTEKEKNHYLDMLKSDDIQERKESVEFLNANLEVRAIPYLIEFLKTQDYELKELVAKVLIRLNDKSIIPQLLDLSKKQDLSDKEQIRLFEIILRLENDPEKKRDFLVRVINGSFSIKVKEKFIPELGYFCSWHPEPRNTALLIKISKDNEPLLRKAVIYGLQAVARIPDFKIECIDRLIEMVKYDSDASVRASACRALSSIALFGDNEINPLLLPVFKSALTDPDSSVKRVAAQSLGSVGDDSVIPVLEDFIQSTENKWEVEAAQKAIERIKSRITPE